MTGRLVVCHDFGRLNNSGSLTVSGCQELALIDWQMGAHPVHGSIAVAGESLAHLVQALWGHLTVEQRDTIAQVGGTS
jgi:hypothetical protein